MSPLSSSSLWLLFQCSQRCSHVSMTSSSIQLKQHNNSPARCQPVRAASLTLPSLYLKTSICFPKCRQGLIYINLHGVWQGPGGSWAEDRRGSHQSSKGQPLPRAARGDTAAAAPPAQLGGTPEARIRDSRASINASSSTRCSAASTTKHLLGKMNTRSSTLPCLFILHQRFFSFFRFAGV